MYLNDFGEKIKINMSEHKLLSTDTKIYGEVTKIINPFDLNITKNNPYNQKEKNQCCFLEIIMDYEKILVVFKTSEDPNNFYDYFEPLFDGEYPDLFGNGTLNIDLINDSNELVLMYGTSIIILDINTLEVIKYTSSDSIKNYGIKLSYENGIYMVKDNEDSLTKFDKDLKEIIN